MQSSTSPRPFTAAMTELCSHREHHGLPHDCLYRDIKSNDPEKTSFNFNGIDRSWYDYRDLIPGNFYNLERVKHDAKTITDALAENTHVREIVFPLSDRATSFVLKELTRNRSIDYLNMTGWLGYVRRRLSLLGPRDTKSEINHYKDAKVRSLPNRHALTKLIEKSETLKVLNLSLCALDADAMVMLAPAIKSNRSLRAINLAGNDRDEKDNLDENALKILADEIQDNETLTFIRLPGEYKTPAIDCIDNSQTALTSAHTRIFKKTAENRVREQRRQFLHHAVHLSNEFISAQDATWENNSMVFEDNYDYGHMQSLALRVDYKLNSDIVLTFYMHEKKREDRSIMSSNTHSFFTIKCSIDALNSQNEDLKMTYAFVLATLQNNSMCRNADEETYRCPPDGSTVINDDFRDWVLAAFICLGYPQDNIFRTFAHVDYIGQELIRSDVEARKEKVRDYASRMTVFLRNNPALRQVYQEILRTIFRNEASVPEFVCRNLQNAHALLPEEKQVPVIAPQPSTALITEMTQFMKDWKGSGLKVDDLSQLKSHVQAQLAQFDTMLQNAFDIMSRHFEISPASRAEQAYIQQPGNEKLANYLAKLEQELSRFIYVYFIVNSGVILTANNRKGQLIDAIGNMPMTCGLLKPFTMVLQHLNASDRAAQINRLADLFVNPEMIIYVAHRFARQLTLIKAQEIQSQITFDRSGITGRIRNTYDSIKDTLFQQWHNLKTSDTSGLNLHAEERLAILDAAFLLEFILSGRTPVLKGTPEQLVSQFLKIAMKDVSYEYNTPANISASKVASREMKLEPVTRIIKTVSSEKKKEPAFDPRRALASIVSKEGLLGAKSRLKHVDHKQSPPSPDIVQVIEISGKKVVEFRDHFKGSVGNSAPAVSLVSRTVPTTFSQKRSDYDDVLKDNMKMHEDLNALREDYKKMHEELNALRGKVNNASSCVLL